MVYCDLLNSELVVGNVGIGVDLLGVEVAVAADNSANLFGAADLAEVFTIGDCKIVFNPTST